MNFTHKDDTLFNWLSALQQQLEGTARYAFGQGFFWPFRQKKLFTLFLLILGSNLSKLFIVT